MIYLCEKYTMCILRLVFTTKTSVVQAEWWHHDDITIRKVFACPESFCIIDHLKDMSQIARLSGNLSDGLKTFQIIWKIYRWCGKCSDNWEIWIFGRFDKFPDIVWNI